jgi:O-methyltransferase
MQILKRVVGRTAERLGYRIERLGTAVYDAGGMTIRSKHTPFLEDARFMSAYRRGVNSGHAFGDIHIEWSCAVACWAAVHGSKLPGDFVECGVNTGILSLTICNYLNFNALGKSFYLFDTFSGIPLEQMSAAERPDKSAFNARHYVECFETAQRNFSPFPTARLVRGKVPETLTSVEIDKVCYLSIDMNIAYPERKAIEHFWPKLSAGAFVVLDDYGFYGYEEQMAAMDQFAESVGVKILALPTGQGLIIKP